MTTAKRTLPFSKRGFSPETMMWIFTRISALAIYAFMLVGVIGALIISAQNNANLADVLRWAFFPSTSPNPLSTMPWIALLAKLMMMAFMLIVAAHGVHGIVEVADDYLPRSWRRTYLNIIIAIFVVSNLVVAYVLFFAAK